MSNIAKSSFSNINDNGNDNDGFMSDATLELYSIPEKCLPTEVINQSFDEKPSLRPQILGALVCASAHMSVGCILGYTSVSLPSLMDKNSTDIVLDQFQAAVFSGIINIGAIIGSLLSSLMMTWLGQKSTILTCTPVGIIFWTIMGFSNSFWLLSLSRLIQGMVLGILVGCSTSYVIETAHESVRGRFSALLQFSVISGVIFVSVVGSTLSWRYVAFICGTFSMALPLIGMSFFPHSPRWLALRGLKTEARKSLIFFRGSNYDVDTEMKCIEKQIEVSSKTGTVWNQLKLLTDFSIGFRFVIVSFLLFASAFSGSFAFMTYSVSIFQSAHVNVNPYTSTIIIKCVKLFGAVLYMSLVDKSGRRILLTIPLFLSGLCMFVMGSFFYFKNLNWNMNEFKYLPLITTMLYMIFSMMSLPILSLWQGELMPTQVRAVAVSLAFCFYFCGNFVVSISYFHMVDTIGSHWTFWFYGIVNIVIVVVAAICIPETKGKSLEDIEDFFKKKCESVI